MAVVSLFIVFLFLKNAPLPHVSGRYMSSTAAHEGTFTGVLPDRRAASLDRVSTISPLRQSPTVSSRGNLTTQDSFDFFLSVFGLSQARSSKSDKNSEKRLRPSCRVKYEWHILGKRVFPRRIKVGFCGALPCSSNDVTSSCQPSRTVSRDVFVKRCDLKIKKTPWKTFNGKRKNLRRRARRCEWQRNVVLSTVACKSMCRN